MATTIETIVAGHVPAGRWGVAVSGGADSVALLELLRHRPELYLHVIHLDHETRAGQSGEDARFVERLANAWGLDRTIALRSEIERTMSAALPKNQSARYRAVRLELFRRTVVDEKLAGVILAHHADDQAETVMQRLLRGSGPAGLTGMSVQSVVGGVVLQRPLLGVRREMLRSLLRERGVAWREDASNASLRQQRNRVRDLLSRQPRLHDRLIELASVCARLERWLDANSPVLSESFALPEVRSLVAPLARHALRRWLSERAGAGIEIPPAAVERMLAMVTDAATPARQHFPGGVLVHRRAGQIL